MKILQIQYVLKIAELQSFSKAAKELYISQPSLSQHIFRLEEQLGVPLFDRTTMPLKLTYAGECYVEKARQILNLNNQLLREIEDITTFKKGRLILGVPLFSGAFLLPVILPMFHQKYPGIELVIIEKTSSDLEQSVLKEEVDFAIFNTPSHSEGIVCETILTEEIMLAIPPDRKSPLNYSVNLSELKDKHFILLRRESTLRQIVNEYFKLAGFNPRIFIESRNIITVSQLVKAGSGITFIPETIAYFSGIPRNFLHHIEGSVQSWNLVLTYKKGRYLSKLDQAFITVAKEVLSNFKKRRR